MEPSKPVIDTDTTILHTITTSCAVLSTGYALC